MAVVNIPLPDTTIKVKGRDPYCVVNKTNIPDIEGKTITNRVKLYHEIDYIRIQGELDGVPIEETHTCDHKGWMMWVRLLDTE